jgi:hypothetical protein
MAALLHKKRLAVVAAPRTQLLQKSFLQEGQLQA